MRYSTLFAGILFFASCASQPQQHDYFTKEEFKDKITRGVPSVEVFEFLDTSKRNEIDLVFNLPTPTYKARVIATNAPNDTFYFYFFARNYFDTVLLRKLMLPSFDTRYFPAELFLDTASNNCVTYFRSLAGYDFEDVNPMDKQLELMLGYQMPKLTAGEVELIEVRQEEKRVEPPPPPPPIPRRKK